MKHLFLTIIFGSFYFTVFSQEVLQGKIVEVIDGNTVLVQNASGDEPLKILLAEIDSPEMEQSYGAESKALLNKLVLNKKVTVTIHAKDRLGNLLAVVLIQGKKDPRIDLLQAGFAWTSEKNPNPTLEKYRISAQEKQQGLWVENNPTPPWTFRRQESMKQAKAR